MGANMGIDENKLPSADVNKIAEILDNLSSTDHSIVREAAFEAANLNIEEALPKLVELFNSSSVGVQDACEFAVRKIRGKNAVDLVIPVLRSEDVTVRNIAMDILRDICMDNIESVVELIYDEDSDIRIFSSDILGTSGSQFALVPLCNALLQDVEANVRYQAAISLGTLGNPEAANSLSQALNDEEWVQYAVIEALAKLRDSNSVEILINSLDTATPLVSSMIIEALGDIKSIKATPFLLNYIENSSEPLKIKSLKSIIQILGSNALNLIDGKQFTQLQNYLIETIKSEQDEDVLKIMLTGLSYIGVNPLGTKTILEFIATLDLPTKQNLLQIALECLITIGYNESLEHGLLSNDDLVRKITIEACGSLDGKAGKYAIKRHLNNLPLDDKVRSLEIISPTCDSRDIPYFLNLMSQDQEPEILCVVFNFIGELQQYIEAAPLMLEFLNHPDVTVREAALEACLALDDEQTIMNIVSLIDNEDSQLRQIAVYTMGRINAEYFFVEISNSIHDVNEEVRKIAVQSIGYGIDNLDNKLPHLFEAMKDNSKEVRLTAIEFIGENVTEETIPVLVEALSDEDDWVKIRAISSLAQNHVLDIIPVFVEMMENENVLVQMEILNGLAVIGGDKAIQHLLKFVSHEVPEIQTAAQNALEFLSQNSGGYNE